MKHLEYTKKYKEENKPSIERSYYYLDLFPLTEYSIYNNGSHSDK